MASPVQEDPTGDAEDHTDSQRHSNDDPHQQRQLGHSETMLPQGSLAISPTHSNTLNDPAQPDNFSPPLAVAHDSEDHADDQRRSDDVSAQQD
ncbi:hypothetical protein CMUS01_10393 [Colletotrichum musicola]|uniref:Uncharacterized protein n=1 Tax=Colletotrichum musicola TaxID=2175873 RepID=A0A8H6K4A1_9PEZI|nr:hypothetical protein CMUS01_10393 [Colletotrichum musicola]